MEALQKFENFCKKHMSEGVREADRVSFEETFSNLMTKALETLALGKAVNVETLNEIANYLYRCTFGMFTRDEAVYIASWIIDDNDVDAGVITLAAPETIH
uniref:Uncharacterized protein n=1 Tax=Rhizobium phage LG08 TaxID=3129229 RepID=A0AAU8HXX2_9CAUD